MRTNTRLGCALAALGMLLPAAPVRADGAGVLIQRQDDRLITGFDTGSGLEGSQGLGGGAFGGVVGSDSLTQFPSFLSLANAPSGSEDLPVGQAVHWDFLPLTTGGATANLMHWSGSGEVSLAPAADASLTLFDPAFNAAAVDGSAAAVPGLRLGTTTSSSLYRLHAHRLWFLEGGAGAAPAPGVYVTAVRTRTDGLTPSRPVYIALGTPGLADAVFEEAVPWLEANYESLLLRGDYNFDGLVDGADLALWSEQYGDTAPQPVDLGEADGNGDGRIDAADYVAWRNARASAAATARVVPEPSAAILALFGALLALSPLAARASRRSARPR